MKTMLTVLRSLPFPVYKDTLSVESDHRYQSVYVSLLVDVMNYLTQDNLRKNGLFELKSKGL